MEKREKFLQELEQSLEKLNFKVDEFETKFNDLKADMRQKYHGELEKLRSHREKIRYDLSLLKTASESAFDEMEKGIRKAAESLKVALQSAKEKLGY